MNSAASRESTGELELLATTCCFDPIPQILAVRYATVDSRMRCLMHNGSCQFPCRYGLVAYIARVEFACASGSVEAGKVAREQADPDSRKVTTEPLVAARSVQPN